MEREELVKLLRSTIVLCQDETAVKFMEAQLQQLMEPPPQPKVLVVDVTELQLSE